MFILKTGSLEQARSWIATDPAVKAGRLVPEFLKWRFEKGSLKQTVGRALRLPALRDALPPVSS